MTEEEANRLIAEAREETRAKCEAIALANAKFWGPHTNRGIPCLNIADEIAALKDHSESLGTMACPICGVGTPHTHTAQERFAHDHKETADAIAALKGNGEGKS